MQAIELGFVLISQFIVDSRTYVFKRPRIELIASDIQVIVTKLQLIKMRTKLANLNDCAVPFLIRAAVNLYWYYYNTTISITVNNFVMFWNQ